MADEVLMYAVAFTGLFGEGLKDVAPPTFHAELRKLGVDLAKPLPGYPYALWESAIELTAPLFPALTREQRHEELGRRTVLGSTGNPLLKAVLAATGLIGTTRALKRIIQRSGSHSTNVITFGEETKTSLVVHSGQVGSMPYYSVGSFKALIELLGGKNARGDVLAFTAPAGSFRMSWD